MIRRQSGSGLLAAALMLLATAGGAAAQEFRATVRGQVVDSSQGAVPGTTVTVRNQETNEVATATTNQEGSYTIPFLRPGTLHPDGRAGRASRNTPAPTCGFRSARPPKSTCTLSVDGLTEQVTVVSEAPLLETSRADRGTVIDSARIAELPLQSRSPMALAVLVAGVNYNAQAIYLRPFDNGALANWSMNGGATSNNEFLLDGAPNNANQGGNNIAYVPPAEAVQEMKISTNSYDAQYGRTAGGVVNMSLKSGTNSFHGVVYDFMRRKALAANSFLLNSRNSPKTDQYIDQYGFSVDGPIWKNKTFFLFTGEKYREGTPAPLFSTVPTPAFKNGDFSGLVDASGRLITIYDPATGRDVNGVWTRDPFPGNRIPAESHQSRHGAGDHELLPGPEQQRPGGGAVAAEPGVGRSLQQGPVLELGRQGRPQLRRQRPGLLPLGGERAERDRQPGVRHPQRSRPGRPAAAHPGQPRDGRRLGAHLRSRHRLQPARRLHLLPGMEPVHRRVQLRCDRVLAFQPGRSAAQQAARRPVPARRDRSVRGAVARHQPRTGTGTGRCSRTCR